jgi:hypothetical protein
VPLRVYGVPDSVIATEQQLELGFMRCNPYCDRTLFGGYWIVNR